jgi:hypothetical protein
MKIGFTLSLLPYDAAARDALQSANPRHFRSCTSLDRCWPFNLRAIQRIDLEENRPDELSPSRGCLDFALHKSANVAHGDSEIVLGLQVDPELRNVAEITAEAERAVAERLPFGISTIRPNGTRSARASALAEAVGGAFHEIDRASCSQMQETGRAIRPRLDGGAELFRGGHCRFSLILSR